MASDYYSILGVEPSAPLEEIKRRYRQLVRENHPDVARDKTDAHARMQEILLAWSTLSDASRRARYDLDRLQAERSRNSALSPVAPAEFNRRPAATRPLDIKEQVRKRARVQQNMGGKGATRTINPRTRLLTMVFDAAQLYYVEGRSEEAIRVINQVLRADPTNAEAAVLLGDIYVQQTNKSMALSMYERAVRLQPANMLYRQKLEALRHPNHADSEAPVASRSTAANPWAKPTQRQTLSDRIEQAGDSQSEPRATQSEEARRDLLRVARAAVQAQNGTSKSDNEVKEITADLKAIDPEMVESKAPPAAKASLLSKLRSRWSR